MNPNPDDTGPSKQEREVQRLRDTLKDLARIDTFEEVLSWSSNEMDLTQRAKYSAHCSSRRLFQWPLKTANKVTVVP